MEDFLFETEDEALTAVLHDGVALINDGPLVEYLTSRKSQYNPNCTLKSIGDGRFSPSGYALGLTKNSPYTGDFSLAILELRENSELKNIRAEYFSHRRTCDSEIAMTSASLSIENTRQLNLQEFLSLFILLAIAVAISLVTLFIECTCKEHWDHIKGTLFKKFYIIVPHHTDESVTLTDYHEGLRTSTEL